MSYRFFVFRTVYHSTCRHVFANRICTGIKQFRSTCVIEVRTYYMLGNITLQVPLLTLAAVWSHEMNNGNNIPFYIKSCVFCSMERPYKSPCKNCLWGLLKP